MSSRRSRQGRQDDPHDLQAEVQVLAEPAGLDQFLQFLVRRADQPHIDPPRLVGAHADDLAVLDDAQEFDLRGHRHVADFVEEERPAVGVLEAALAGREGPGERAFLVSEEFALQDAFAEGGAVEGDEVAAAAGRVVVQGLGDEFLAGAALALDEDGGVGRGDLAQRLDDAPHRLRLADDPLEPEPLLELLGELLGAADEAPVLQGLGHAVAQFGQVQGLGDVVGGALADGLDGGLDRGVAGDDDDLGLRVQPPGRLQDLQAADLVHHQVGDDEVEGVVCHDLQGPPRLGDDDAGVAGPGEGLGDGVGLGPVVFDDEQPRGRRGM